MRLILADHHLQPCLALKMILAEEPDMDLICEVGDAQELITLAEQHAPDLVLLDSDLPGEDLECIIARLHALESKPFVVVMSSDIASSRLILKSGADAFVSKVDDPAWLVEKLRTYVRIRSKENADSDKPSQSKNKLEG